MKNWAHTDTNENELSGREDHEQTNPIYAL